MNRLVGIAAAMLLALVMLVPAAAAAEPWPASWGRTEQVILATGTDITLPAGQSVDTLVVINGHARVEGSARAIFVVGGTVDLVGGRSNGIVAVQSRLSLDAASVVNGDVRSFESSIAGVTGATLIGRVRDVGPDMFGGWIGIGSVLFLIYVAFAISMLVAGVVVAGLAGRQIRAATALIDGEPVQVVGAGLLGLIGLFAAAILAIVTLVGIPFGLGLLLLVLPGLFVAGYIVAGIWLGERIVGRASGAEIRERPYLAAVVGLAIVGAVSIVPFVGGVISLVGFGAVVLRMWRVARGTRPSAAGAPVGGGVAPAAG